MRVLAVSILAIAALGAAAPAAAQARPGAKPSTDVRADRRSTAESIAAQYAAEQFRAARVADETTLRLLDENAAQRRRIAAVMKDAKATAGQRDQARAELRRLDAELKAANERLLATTEAGDELRAQIAEYERQIAEAVEAASPEVLAAYEQYARGDRDAGYAVIDRLSQSEAEAALRAGQVRAGALLRRPAVLAQDRRLRGEMTTAACIAAWERAQAADPHYAWGWIELAELYQSAGRLADKRRALEQATQSAGDDYERAVSLTMTADALQQSGQLVPARAKVAESVDLFRDLAARTPDDLVNQQALGIAYRKLGDIEGAAGSEREAMAALQAGVEQMRRTVERWPDDDATLGYLAEAVQGLGDLQSDQGDYEGAARSFREALEISRTSAEAAPQDMERLKDIAEAAGRLGVVLGWLGRRDEAAPLLEEYLKITRGLAARDPTNMEARRSISFALDSLADFRLEGGDHAAALPLYEEALAIRREAWESDSSSAVNARFHAATTCDLATALHRAGDDAAAAGRYDACLAGYRALSAADPTNTHLHRDVWLTWWAIARELRRPGAWREMAAAMEALDRIAPLSARDAPFLALAREEAAKEAAGATAAARP